MLTRRASPRLCQHTAVSTTPRVGEPEHLDVAYPRLGLWVQELRSRHDGDDLAGGMSDSAGVDVGQGGGRRWVELELELAFAWTRTFFRCGAFPFHRAPPSKWGGDEGPGSAAAGVSPPLIICAHLPLAARAGGSLGHSLLAWRALLPSLPWAVRQQPCVTVPGARVGPGREGWVLPSFFPDGASSVQTAHRIRRRMQTPPATRPVSIDLFLY